jgi:hypothetical protein
MWTAFKCLSIGPLELIYRYLLPEIYLIISVMFLHLEFIVIYFYQCFVLNNHSVTHLTTSKLSVPRHHYRTAE